MDPKDLNEAIMIEHYQIPTREEIRVEMAGAQWFAKLNAAHGFWQLKLDEKSAELSTFNTPFGVKAIRDFHLGSQDLSQRHENHI